MQLGKFTLHTPSTCPSKTAGLCLSETVPFDNWTLPVSPLAGTRPTGGFRNCWVKTNVDKIRRFYGDFSTRRTVKMELIRLKSALFRRLFRITQQLLSVVLTRGQKTWGIEVKAASVLTSKDGQGLVRLAGRCGEDFESGVLLHAGRDRLPLADERMLAVPLSELWER